MTCCQDSLCHLILLMYMYVCDPALSDRLALALLQIYLLGKLVNKGYQFGKPAMQKVTSL